MYNQKASIPSASVNITFQR